MSVAPSPWLRRRFAPSAPRLRRSPPACPRTVRLRRYRSLQHSSPSPSSGVKKQKQSQKAKSKSADRSVRSTRASASLRSFRATTARLPAGMPRTVRLRRYRSLQDAPPGTERENGSVGRSAIIVRRAKKGPDLRFTTNFESCHQRTIRTPPVFLPALEWFAVHSRTKEAASAALESCRDGPRGAGV